MFHVEQNSSKRDCLYGITLTAIQRYPTYVAYLSYYEQIKNFF